MAGELLPQPVQDKPLAHTPKYKRLGQQHVKTIFELDKLGKTQTEIAQALSCDQATVSRWLATKQDTRDLATQYLTHNALPMAQNIVRKGKPDVQLKALQGLGVAAEGGDSGPKVVIQIGGNAQDVRVAVALSPSVTVQAGESSENP